MIVWRKRKGEEDEVPAWVKEDPECFIEALRGNRKVHVVPGTRFPKTRSYSIQQTADLVHTTPYIHKRYNRNPKYDDADAKDGQEESGKNARRSQDCI
jgi:hypothetical protein